MKNGKAQRKGLGVPSNFGSDCRAPVCRGLVVASVVK